MSIVERILGRWYVLIVVLFPSFAFAAQPSMNSKAPVEITADALSVDEANHQATFTGNVKAVQGNVTLTADKMIVHYIVESKTGNNISDIDVIGNVLLTTDDETAKGNRGNYDVENHIITLIGDVILTKGQNLVSGGRLTYNINTGKSSIAQVTKGKGRVKGIFVPGGGEVR